MRGWQNEIAIGRRVAARLAQHAETQVVTVAGKVLHLLKHGGARYVQYAARDDAARLTTGMCVDGLNCALESHVRSGGMVDSRTLTTLASGGTTQKECKRSASFA